MIRIYICYAMISLLSCLTILGASWFFKAVLTAFSNNLNTVSASLQSVNVQGDSPLPGNKNENIFWFVQISDIHISKYRDYGQLHDLERFCTERLSTMKPAVVLVTGDLTDAKDTTLLGSIQYEEEWIAYEKIVKSCKQHTVMWLDVRGNHDSFQVPKLRDKVNYFEQYGVARRKYKDGVLQYVHKTSFGNYAFNGIDLAPDPGPGRPFNFFAIPSQKTLKAIEQLSKSSKNYNGSIWYGHYPLSVTTQVHALRSFLSTGVAYLCGHLHTMLGIFPRMHAIHNEGFLELELGDWKESRRFRVGVFDHDVFSFVDADYSKENPVVVVTNPPSAEYLIDIKVPVWKARASSHIRFLLFHKATFKSIHVLIDGHVMCETTEVDGHLHTCSWKPSLFESGVHNMIIELTNSDGQTLTFDHQFSLDGTRVPLGLRTIILLLPDFASVCFWVYFLTVMFVIVLPVALKKCSGRGYLALIKRILKKTIPQHLYVLEHDEVFCPIFAYSCFLAFGPNSVGYFVPDQIGVQFPYGIFTGTAYLPGTLTYIYTSSQLILINVFASFYLGEKLMTRQKEYGIRSNCRKFLFVFLILFLIWFQASRAYMYFIAYGKLACLINPLATWSIPFTIYLVKKVNGITN